MPTLRNKKTGQIIVVPDGGGIAPNPIKVQGAQADLENSELDARGKRIKNQTDAATQAATIAEANARAEEARLKAAAARAAQSLPDVTPAVRADALNTITTALGMTPKIEELEQLYREGPGATRGIQGLQDYNPFNTGTERFNTAANQFRGAVKSSQGFTGGEGNTAAEMKLNVGAFIPSAGQRDATIKDNIKSLKRERNQGVLKAVATIGGFPDANGKVTPTPAGYFIGRYPELDLMVAKKISGMKPEKRQQWMLESYRRYDKQMRAGADDGWKIERAD